MPLPECALPELPFKKPIIDCEVLFAINVPFLLIYTKIWLASAVAARPGQSSVRRRGAELLNVFHLICDLCCARSPKKWRGPTHRARVVGHDAESAAGPDTQSAGSRHRERRAPTTQRAPGPDRERESGGTRHRERRGPTSRVSMANYTLTDLLLFSIYIYIHTYIYIKNSDCMRLDAGDSRCDGRSFSLKKRTDDPERVRQWLLQSWVSVCFAQRLFLKARMH